MPRYQLTQEGLEYLKEGLPELNLVRVLTQPLTIEQAAQKVKRFAIALQWAKAKGWVGIKDGRLHLLRRPEQPAEQTALQTISEGKEIGQEMAEALLKRRLIKEVREDAFTRAKRLSGKEISGLTSELIITGGWRNVQFKPYNVTVPGPQIWPGKRQPYVAFLRQVRASLVELGFREMTGPSIETEFWNFDALYQPQNHPARDWTNTYSLKNPKSGDLPGKKIVRRVKAAHENGWETGSTGWGYRWDPSKAAKLMPRAHGTALSARTLASNPTIPGKYFAIVRCFRPDIIDATHGVEFNQCEGIVIDPSLTFRNMLGLLKQFAIEMAGAAEVKFLPDYYPFVEPGVQVSAKHPQMGWVELAGAGMFREELTKPLGVDEPVIAWGFGIDRLAMFKLGINDIRELFSRNLDWLRNSKTIF